MVKPQIHNKGYLKVVIGKKSYYVHRLVAQKYITNPENKSQVNHIDGNKMNNSVENLEWVTNLENRKHSVKNGLHLMGEKCPFAKLTEKDVIEIFLNKVNTSRELAQKYVVSIGTINDIKGKRTWKKTIEKIC